MSYTIIDVPIGAVIAFASNNIPDGWVICDGSAIDSNQDAKFQDLYKVLGTIWGSGDGNAGSFNLPDMRGLFLRGVDFTANNDPDKGSRTVQHNGGKSGNSVGSLQMDDFRSHTHSQLFDSNSAPGNNRMNGGGSTINIPSTYSGGNETRPKNVYVIYMIKYQNQVVD